MDKNKINKSIVLKTIGKIAMYFAGVLIIFICVFPFLWVLISTFKSTAEIQSIKFHFFPKTWTFENYNNLFKGNSVYFPKGVSFIRSLGMTLLVSIVALTLSLAVNSLAAYAFGRLRFPGKKALWALYAINMFVPNIAVLIPCYYVVTKLHLINNFWVLVLPGVTYIWSIFFYRQYYLGIPKSLEEAALVDGCSRFGIYLRVFLPMSVTPFIVMGLSVFQGFWNSYIWPSMTVFGDANLYQVNQLIAYFRNSQGTSWDMLLTSTIVSSIPSILILIIIQKYIMQGIKITGMK